jgi:hypothetical protein
MFMVCHLANGSTPMHPEIILFSLLAASRSSYDARIYAAGVGKEIAPIRI